MQIIQREISDSMLEDAGILLWACNADEGEIRRPQELVI